MRWLSTLSLPSFDTGLLRASQYALAGVRRDGAQLYWVSRADDSRKIVMHPYIQQVTVDVISGLTEITVVGTHVVDEWLEDDGTITREVGTVEKLDRLRTVPGEPVPIRTTRA